MQNNNHPQNVDLASNSVMLVVRLGRPGNQRKVQSSMVEVDADPDALHISKELLQSPELKAVIAHDDQVRRWIYSRSLPSYGTLRDGVYRLPLSLVDAVDAELEEFRQQRQLLINAFLERYPAMVNEAAARLRVLYHPQDYPTVDEIAGRFTFDYRYLSFGTPETLSAQLLAREREKAAAEITTEVEEIKLALRSSFAELVYHAADRLRVGPNGKKMVFRDSLVHKLEDFLTYFNQRNIVDDRDLAALVERARAVMQGLAPQELRDNDSLRQQVQNTMQIIKDEMDAGMMLQPTRRLVLEPALMTKGGDHVN